MGKIKKKKRIKKVAIFFNNLRGLLLSNYLKKNKFIVTNIITKKFLNKKILKKLNKNNYILINNLKSKNLENFLKKQKFDLLIVAGFPHIFKKNYSKISEFGIINLHGGKLPKYRGGSPLNWQIINNEKKIGITVILIKLNKKIDAGDIINEKSFKNIKNNNIWQVHKKANKLFLNLTLNSIKKLEKNISLRKQPTSKSYHRQRNDSDSLINWNKRPHEVFNFVRALSYPYKGAFTYYKSKKIRITKCKVSNHNPKIRVGKFFSNEGKNLYVKCKEKSIIILESNPNFKRFIKKR